MDTALLNLSQLRGMIGRRIRFRGDVYTVVEVLDDGPAIVIQSDRPDTAIQTDTYGYAHRQVKEAITLQVLTPDKSEFDPDFLAIEQIEP